MAATKKKKKNINFNFFLWQNFHSFILSFQKALELHLVLLRATSSARSAPTQCCRGATRDRQTPQATECASTARRAAPRGYRSHCNSTASCRLLCCTSRPRGTAQWRPAVDAQCVDIDATKNEKTNKQRRARATGNDSQIKLGSGNAFNILRPILCTLFFRCARRRACPTEVGSSLAP